MLCILVLATVSKLFQARVVSGAPRRLSIAKRSYGGPCMAWRGWAEDWDVCTSLDMAVREHVKCEVSDGVKNRSCVLPSTFSDAHRRKTCKYIQL